MAGERRVPWVDPRTRDPLIEDGGALLDRRTRRPVAPVIDGIPRFVEGDDYAGSFGWQWNRWDDIFSAERGSRYRLRQLIMERTRFDRYDLEGKTLLECGMGSGGDTEVLLDLPLAEVHGFDLSTSVERAAERLDDERLFLCRASIFEMPYPDESFDVVFCHRMLQHTPDPERALRCCCAKVKPGGLLFAHSYKKSFHYMMGWKYKYRWLTRRLPWDWVHAYVERCGPFLHRLNAVAYRWFPSRVLAYSFVPFHHAGGLAVTGGMSRDELIELEKCITFDALTPRYDRPMTSKRFRSIIESEGFEIEHIDDPASSPIYCTAVRARPAARAGR